MKKTVMVLVAASFFAAQVPAMAMAHNTGHDEGCAKQCGLQVRNCGQEVDSIQQRISKLKNAIEKHADNYSADELRGLKAKLKDAESTLATLQTAGA